MSKRKYTLTTEGKIAAYEKVLKAVDDGIISPRHNYAGATSCSYERKARGKVSRCAVGCLFTPKQIADVKRRRLNTSTGVYELAKHIGKANIEAVTGLPVARLSNLQDQHDAVGAGLITMGTFREYVEKQINQLKRSRPTHE